MRVYVKKENKNSMVPGIFVTIIFLSISIFVFISFFKSEKSFIDALTSFGITLLFAIVFFGFSMYFIYELIKRPRGYKAKLVDKKIETYNGKQIVYMEFDAQKEKEQVDFISSKYRCYTIGNNNSLIVGNYYSLRIKEFNWEPKYIEEIDNPCEKTKKVTSQVPNITMFPVFLSMGLIFAGLLIFSMLNIFSM